MERCVFLDRKLRSVGLIVSSFRDEPEGWHAASGQSARQCNAGLKRRHLFTSLLPHSALIRIHAPPAFHRCYCVR